ncbi:MAG: hypothetical protein RIR41_1189 [Pseudomonadota bacterium]
MTLRELHLFAGVGGGILGGMLLGHVPVCAVEIDPYCRKVLEARQRDGVLPAFPILEDVRAFDGKPWRGKVDVVCGGFPCQPWSQAGKRLGTADPRHLWPEMARIIREVRPSYVFAENVAIAAFQEPYSDLVAMGYRVPPALCLGASHVGAPHRRLRWWLLAADADRIEHEGGTHAERGAATAHLPADADRSRMHELDAGQHVAWSGGVPPAVGGDGGAGQVADANGERLAQRQSQRGHHGEELASAVGGGLGHTDRQRELQPEGTVGTQRRRATDAGWWTAEPDVGRVAHGVPSRVDRLRALGNAQVPAVAAAAFLELWQRLELEQVTR